MDKDLKILRSQIIDPETNEPVHMVAFEHVQGYNEAVVISFGIIQACNRMWINSFGLNHSQIYHGLWPEEFDYRECFNIVYPPTMESTPVRSACVFDTSVRVDSSDEFIPVKIWRELTNRITVSASRQIMNAIIEHDVIFGLLDAAYRVAPIATSVINPSVVSASLEMARLRNNLEESGKETFDVILKTSHVVRDLIQAYFESFTEAMYTDSVVKGAIKAGRRSSYLYEFRGFIPIFRLRLCLQELAAVDDIFLPSSSNVRVIVYNITDVTAVVVAVSETTGKLVPLYPDIQIDNVGGHNVWSNDSGTVLIYNQMTLYQLSSDIHSIVEHFISNEDSE